MGAPQSLRQLSTADIYGRRASRAEMQQIIDELQLADEAWGEAQERARTLRQTPASPTWAVMMRDERGYRKQLPDLAVWRRGSKLPVAIVGEEGHRREDRQRMILEGWREAIWSDQYAAVQYDWPTLRSRPGSDALPRGPTSARRSSSRRRSEPPRRSAR